MPILGWRVHFTRRQLPMPRSPRPLLLGLPTEAIPAWLDREEIPDRVPCLIAPGGTYDFELNNYFLLNPAPENTQAAIAYDLAGFLTFLWCHRQPLGRRSWRDATPDDRAAYQRWRRSDERGPGVKGSTWGREVATVNGFYRWAEKRGLVAENPIRQRASRSWHGYQRPDGATTPGRGAQGRPPRGPGLASASHLPPLAGCRSARLPPDRRPGQLVPRPRGFAQRDLLRPDGPDRAAADRTGQPHRV